MKRFLSLFNQYKGLSQATYVIFYARMITNMGAFIWPLLTLILSRKIGYTPSQIALLSVVVGLIFMPANIIGGKLADRFNKKTIIIVFDLLSVILFIACGFVPPSNTMVVLFVLAGMFANMEGPAFDALIAESTKPKERDKVYSLSYLGANLGLVIGATVGGLLFENYLNLAFIFDGLTTLSSTLLIVIFVKTIDLSSLQEGEINSYEASEETKTTTLSILLNRPSVFNQLIIFALGALIYNQWTFTLPLYMSDIFLDKGALYFGTLASFNGFIVIAFTPLLTYLLRHNKELTKMALGVGLFGLSFLILLVSKSLWLIFVMMAVFTWGEVINTLGAAPFVSRRVPASHRGRINSYRNLSYFVGGMGGRLVIGMVVETWGYNIAFASLSILGLTLAALTIMNSKRDQLRFPDLYRLKNEA